MVSFRKLLTILVFSSLSCNLFAMRGKVELLRRSVEGYLEMTHSQNEDVVPPFKYKIFREDIRRLVFYFGKLLYAAEIQGRQDRREILLKTRKNIRVNDKKIAEAKAFLERSPKARGSKVFEIQKPIFAEIEDFFVFCRVSDNFRGLEAGNVAKWNELFHQIRGVLDSIVKYAEKFAKEFRPRRPRPAPPVPAKPWREEASEPAPPVPARSWRGETSESTLMEEIRGFKREGLKPAGERELAPSTRSEEPPTGIAEMLQKTFKRKDLQKRREQMEEMARDERVTDEGW